MRMKYSIHPGPSIRCSIGSSPVGVQCVFDYLFSCVVSMCLCLAPFSIILFVTPFLYISPSAILCAAFNCCFPFHLSEHHLLHQFVVFHGFCTCDQIISASF